LIMRKRWFCTIAVLLSGSGLLGSSQARAGSAAIGSLAASLNASVGGQALLANSTIFSGDRLRVKEGAAIVVLTRGARMAFGRSTEAGFLRDSKGITVLLEEGSVSVFQPITGSKVRVVALKVEVSPARGYKSLGEVAALNGVVFVTTKLGILRVAEGGRTVKLAQGKSLTIRPGQSAFPQGGPSASAGAPPMTGGGPDRNWKVLELSAGGTGVILSAVALGHAGSSNSTANSALSTAQSALTTASAASSAASAAAAAATAASQAAAEATSVAEASVILEEITNNMLGCKLNILANELGQASPYTPPAGFSCPAP
jgi:hypothetical protein